MLNIDPSKCKSYLKSIAITYIRKSFIGEIKKLWQESVKLMKHLVFRCKTTRQVHLQQLKPSENLCYLRSLSLPALHFLLLLLLHRLSNVPGHVSSWTPPAWTKRDPPPPVLPLRPAVSDPPPKKTSLLPLCHWNSQTWRSGSAGRLAGRIKPNLLVGTWELAEFEPLTFQRQEF